MAATRVRLLPEHRNGNGNYLRTKHGGQFVASDGEKDLHAICLGFLVMCDEIGFKPSEVRAELQRVIKTNAASHD